ncbi:hypothetical protein HK100_006024 [Physocladia obscura]|uniref:Uncharacterized protein n=1 Tax=Physocladia obscura TaxID=109957 RepID=A0AAD5TAA3_9FUNG|nr:hypothetical protein HK100_006024 [Physocladia obscura]
MLKKSLSKSKWGSLLMLTVGIALVQLPPDNTATPESTANTIASFVGLVAVAIACILSGYITGLAGVWFEKVLKGSNASVWHRNIQLSAYSIIPALISVFVIDYSTVKERGFFSGYNAWSIATIANQAFGGLIVALVVKVHIPFCLF